MCKLCGKTNINNENQNFGTVYFPVVSNGFLYLMYKKSNPLCCASFDKFNIECRRIILKANDNQNKDEQTFVYITEEKLNEYEHIYIFDNLGKVIGIKDFDNLNEVNKNAISEIKKAFYYFEKYLY